MKKTIVAVTTVLLLWCGLSLAAENSLDKSGTSGDQSTLDFLQRLTLARASSGDESMVRSILRQRVGAFGLKAQAASMPHWLLAVFTSFDIVPRSALRCSD